MKKTYAILALVTALSLLLAACGAGQSHMDLPPTDPSYVPGSSVSVDNSPTEEDEYNSCVQAIQGKNPDLINTELFGADMEYWQCGTNPSSGTQYSMMLISATAIAKVTPIKQDDVIVVGVVVIEKVFYVVLAVAAGVTIGEALAWESHTNPDHNPNKLNTTARKQIEALLALIAGGMLTGGPGGPEHKCGVVKDAAGVIIRAFIWVADATYTEGGYTAWYHVNSNRGPWGGAYPKSTADFDSSMSRRDHPEWTSEPRDCNNDFPTPPTFLQAGQ